MAVLCPPVTRGEIKSEVSSGLSSFHRDYIGRGPKSIKAHLVGSHLLVVLQGSLTLVEVHLASLDSVDLLKRFRDRIYHVQKKTLSEIVTAATGVGVVSIHHDVSTLTGEEVIVFSLEKDPVFRKRKGGEC